MAANSSLNITYTLYLYPNEGQWDAYVNWLGGVQIKRTNENAGVDIYCVKDQEVPFTGSATLLDLGVRAKMIKADGFGNREPCHFWTAPRSSIWKNGVTQANSLGVIDSSYRGTLFGAVLPIPKGDTTPVQIKAGTRLFQILAPDMGYINWVSLRPLAELDTTSRGEGGFGSTGK
jgi:dUTP pyrophosphatase